MCKPFLLFYYGPKSDLQCRVLQETGGIAIKSRTLKFFDCQKSLQVSKSDSLLEETLGGTMVAESPVQQNPLAPGLLAQYMGLWHLAVGRGATIVGSLSNSEAP